MEKMLTFAHIERGDVLVAKDGSRWLVGRVERVARTGTTRVRIHRYGGKTDSDAKNMEKPSLTPVVLDRPDEDAEASRADDVAERRAMESKPEPSLSEAVATVESELGGQVVASVTDAQQASLDSAVETGEPIVFPAWEKMTMLSRRSHLYLAHSIIAEDVSTMSELTAMHDDVTKNPVQGKVVPHVHADA